MFPANGSAPTSINGISPADAISVDIPASTNARARPRCRSAASSWT
jgi:hypothetical protein